jgi:ribosomal protein L37AE/L43A
MLAAEPDKYINCEHPFCIDQIKEKFGTLRFYVSGPASDDMMRAIDDAEIQSAHTCEVCSNLGVVRVSKGGFWLKTLCSECAKDEYIPYNRNMMP